MLPEKTAQTKRAHPVCGERRSSIKSCRNWAFLEPIPFLAAFSPSLAEAVLHKARPGEITPRNDALLPAYSQDFCKAHPQNKIPRWDTGGEDPAHPRSQPRAIAGGRHRSAGESIPGPRRTPGAPLSSRFVWKTAAGRHDRRVPLAAKFQPKGFLRRTSS